METVRLQIPPAPRGGTTALSRNCTNNHATCCIYLPTRPSPNTGLRLSLFRNSLPRWKYAPNACLRAAIASKDRPAPTTTPVSEEEDNEIPTLKPKAWFYLFAEAALCSLIWSPSENILRFVFVITSSIALASVEFFRKFVREHIHDMTVRESHRREVEGTLTSDCSRTALPSSSLEFRQGPSSVKEKWVDKPFALRPKVWFYLFIAAAVFYLYVNPSEIKVLLACALASSTALGCVEFFGKFMQKDFHYLRLRVLSRKVVRARTSHCSRTAFPSSSIEFRQGPNPGIDDDEITACERKSSIQFYLLLPVVSFFVVIPFCIFIEVMPSLVARCYSLWTPSDEILAIWFILIPGLITAWGLSVKNYVGHLREFSDSVDCLVRERQKEDIKLNLCTKPQEITEAEGTLTTTAYSRMTFPSKFHQDKHVSGPTTKEDY